MKIAANGIQINIRDRGRGEPRLVFLHYWGGSSRTWAEVIDRLADQHRSIALDHRGWGESDAPAQGYGISDLANDARSVITALELKRYLIIGHSMSQTGHLPMLEAHDAVARAIQEFVLRL